MKSETETDTKCAGSITEKEMNADFYLSIVNKAGELKTTMRHCYTAENRQESVADHSWRIALMAMLLEGVDEFRGVDIGKVIRMCLIHDLGETFTGDIPTFRKNNSDEAKEEDLYRDWINQFPQPQKDQWNALLDEMNALETLEAKTYKAMDKIEALIAHNESDLSTWLPLEYDLQFTYGKENVKFSEFLTRVRNRIDDWTEKVINGDPSKIYPGK